MSSDLRYRLGGVLALMVGLVAGWWGILRPLAAAQAHAPEVSYDIKVFVFVPLAIVFGLFFIVAGAKWPYRHVERQVPTPVGWALMAVAAAASAASFFYFQHQFAVLGYRAGY